MDEEDLQRLRKVLEQFDPSFQDEITARYQQREDLVDEQRFDSAEIIWQLILTKLENEKLKQQLSKRTQTASTNKDMTGILPVLEQLTEVLGNKPHNGRTMVQARIKASQWRTVVNCPSVVLQTALPRQNQGDYQTWDVLNGEERVHLRAGSKLDDQGRMIAGKLPSGKFPRVLLLYINSYVYAYRQPRIFLGHSAAQFFDKLGLSRQGYTYDTFHEQLDRLVRCGIVSGFRYDATDFPDEASYPFCKEGSRTTFQNVSKQIDEFRDFRNQHALEIVLEENFYQSILENPLHVNVDTIKLFGKNLLAMDIYSMLAERLPRIEDEEEIPREDLENLFGCGQEDKARFFRESFKPALQFVHENIYKNANFRLEKNRLILLPSPPANELPNELPPLL